MTKLDRLQYLKTRGKSVVPLSESAAERLELLKKEDSDLGGVCAAYADLAPDSVKLELDNSEAEDESELNTALISPFMRETERETERELRNVERENVRELRACSLQS